MEPLMIVIVSLASYFAVGGLMGVYYVYTNARFGWWQDLASGHFKKGLGYMIVVWPIVILWKVIEFIGKRIGKLIAFLFDGFWDKLYSKGTEAKYKAEAKKKEKKD
jgi:hypothetical protein